MSRSWSKRCFAASLKYGDFREEFVKGAGNVGLKWSYGAFVPTTPERERILCRKFAGKYRTGMRSAPTRWVRDVIEVPFRQACRRMLYRMRRGQVDLEEATFPVNHRTAWWKWS